MTVIFTRIVNQICEGSRSGRLETGDVGRRLSARQVSTLWRQKPTGVVFLRLTTRTGSPHSQQPHRPSAPTRPVVSKQTAVPTPMSFSAACVGERWHPLTRPPSTPSRGRGRRSRAFPFASPRQSLATNTRRRGSKWAPGAYGDRGGGEEIWDPDEQRRVNENRSWRRTDSPNDAWDIDKERDAVMYKRESLERLLALTPKEEKPDRPVVCAKCKAAVSMRSNESQKDRAHVHRLNYGDSIVSVGVYDDATVDVDPKRKGEDAKVRVPKTCGGARLDLQRSFPFVRCHPSDRVPVRPRILLPRVDWGSHVEAGGWWPPRKAVKCCCTGCGEVLGWKFGDNPSESVGPFFALLSARLMTGPTDQEA